MKIPPISKRLIIRVSAITLALGLFSIAFVWYSYQDAPDTLIFYRNRLLLCLRCGAQIRERQISVLNTPQFTVGTSRFTKSGQAAPDACSHYLWPVGSYDTFVPFGKFSILHSNSGTPDGDPFWDRPIVVEAIAGIYVAHREDVFQLVQRLSYHKRNVLIIPGIKVALEGTNSSVLARALYDEYEEHVLTPKRSRIFKAK